MSWSSGKDSAWALHQVRSSGDVEITALLTTVNSEADRVSMHGVRHELLRAQAAALGLPLQVVKLPQPCDNTEYEELMARVMVKASDEGIQHIVFGDLFLEDVRTYREERLAPTGIVPTFPLWRRPTDVMAAEIVASGIRAVLTCVDPAQVPVELAGRWYDEELLADLPASADPCGENGEFHTFVADGPGFARPLDVRVGDIVERDGFVFADVLPVSAMSPEETR